MQLQEAHQHQHLNGQKSQGLLTRLSRCFFLTTDQDRWKSQLSTRVRTPSTSVKLRLGSVELTRLTHAEETEQWLSEDFHRQRCEARARRDEKLCCKVLTALGRREWKTWNDAPLELRKDIERIHRNLGRASADQLEKLFRDANVSDDAISALKHFRCDACDRLKQPPSKREVAVNHAETFNDIVSMDVNFWKITFKESPRFKTTLKVLNIVDAASGMHIAIQIADQTAETIWRAFATGWLRWAGSPRCLRVDPHRSQIARGFFDKAEGRGIFVEPTPAEAHWQMGQVENNAMYFRQTGYRIVEDIDVSQSDFQTMLDELTDAKNSLAQHSGYMPRQWVFGLIPKVPGHMLEENSDLPNLDPEGRFWRIAEMRHKCRMAAIETEANAKIRKSLIGRSRPMRGNYVPGDPVCCWRAGNGVQIKHKVNGWDQLGSVELKEEMSGYLIVRPTAVKCAKEQLRMASPAEREMREMLMRSGGDDPDERSKHGVPRQQDLTQQQPPTESPPQKQKLPPQSPSLSQKQQLRKVPRQQQFHPEPGPQVKQDAPRQEPVHERQESRPHQEPQQTRQNQRVRMQDDSPTVDDGR